MLLHVRIINFYSSQEKVSPPLAAGISGSLENGGAFFVGGFEFLKRRNAHLRAAAGLLFPGL